MHPRAYPLNTGWVEVIAGCMFSGKTEELIRRLNRASYATQKVCVVKPSVDTRYAVGEVVTHNDLRFRCEPVANAADIIRVVGDAQVVGIDEAQFFDDQLPEIVEYLADDGKRVICAGLDLDFRGQPFHPMPQLMAIAEYVQKLAAVCMVCGAPATRSQRLIAREKQVVLGSTDAYEARCRRHWSKDPHPNRQQQLPLE